MPDMTSAWDRAYAKADALSRLGAFPLWTSGNEWVTAPLGEGDRGVLPHDGSWMAGDLPLILWLIAQDGRAAWNGSTLRERALLWSRRLENRTKIRSFASVAHLFFRGALLPLEAFGAEELRPMMMEAGQTVSERFVRIGYMKSFGPAGNQKYPFTTIDDVINLCVPLWYAQQVKDEQLAGAVMSATALIGERLIRADGSTIQVLLFDSDGKPSGVDTYQGRSIDGCWSRGLAWGIYGYAMMYGLSGAPLHLQLGHLMADFWMDRVQDDAAPVWDFSLLPDGSVARDSFAGSLAYAGLLELAAASDPGRAEVLRTYVATMLGRLSDKYVVSHDGLGIVRGAALDVPHDHGVGEEAAVIVGDSYYTEALWRLRRSEPDRQLLGSAREVADS